MKEKRERELRRWAGDNVTCVLSIFIRCTGWRNLEQVRTIIIILHLSVSDVRAGSHGKTFDPS